MSERIARASRETAALIVRLRLAAYGESREFRLLKPECLEWSRVDDEEVVLAAFTASGEAVSTTRGGIVRGAREAAEHLGCSVNLAAHHFPALLLSRGATERRAGQAGLHSALRYYFLRSILNSSICSALGMVYLSAPRTNLMREIGYEFEAPKRVWDLEVEPIQPVMVAHLRADRIAKACQQLESLVGDTLRAYPWHGPPIVWQEYCRESGARTATASP
jgi:hypothetical protein